MIITIYLESEGRKPWRFHIMEMIDEDFYKMINDPNQFRGFCVVNPLYTNIWTKPKIHNNGIETYTVIVNKFIPVEFTGDMIAMCTLQNAT